MHIGMHVCMYMYKTVVGTGSCIVEAKKSHRHLLSASCRTKKASGVGQPESEGLRTGSVMSKGRGRWMSQLGR